MQIFVRQTNGNGYQLEIDEKNSIQQMFFELSQFYNEKPQNYKFFYAGKELTNLKSSLQDLKIKNNSIIHIEKKEQLASSTNSSRQMIFNLNIFSFQHQTLVIKQTSNDTVLKIKHKIYELLKIHPKEQTLIFQGRKLQDSMILKQTNLKNNAMISMVVNRKQSFIDQNQHQFLQSPELFQSITSLHHKSSQNSKTSLFRSDSINKKNAQTQRIEVQIKQKKLKFDFVDLAASVESNVDQKFKTTTPKSPTKQLMQVYKLGGLQQQEEFCFQNDQEQDKLQQQSAYKKLEVIFCNSQNSSQNKISSDSDLQKKTFSKISYNNQILHPSINPEVIKIDQQYEDLQNVEVDFLKI